MSNKTIKLITVREAASILGLNPKTILNGGGGTEYLCRVRLGRSIRLIESEVLAYRDEQISEAKKQIQMIFNPRY